MSELKKPIYIDSRLRRLFERQIARPLQNPKLWGNEMINRLFLLYGQKGSGMEEAILQLILDNKIDFKDVKVTKDAKEMAEIFNNLKTNQNFVPLLVIRKGHLLQYHRDIFLIAHHLKRLTFAGIIIVISEDVPDNENPFWEQFKSRIPMKLPNKDHYRLLLEYYFKRWEQSGSPAVTKIDLDFNQLAVCCDYATPSDVKHFVRRIIDHVIEKYPEERFEITNESIRDFMFASLGVKELLCITNKDGHALQAKYDPEGVTDAPTIEEIDQREPKRAKIYIEGNLGEIPPQ